MAESDAHRLGKEVIMRSDRIWLPDAVRVIHAHRHHIPAHMMSYTNPVAEKGKGIYVPDVVVQTPRGQLVIEIVVTHRITDAKRIWLAQRDIDTIEIDCSALRHLDRIQDVDDHVLRMAPRKWIFSHALAESIRSRTLNALRENYREPEHLERRKQELARQAHDVLTQWKTGPDMDETILPASVRKQVMSGFPQIRNGSPFRIRDEHIGGYLRVYGKDINGICRLLASNGLIRYSMSGDVSKILQDRIHYDFSPEFHIKSVHERLMSSGRYWQ